MKVVQGIKCGSYEYLKTVKVRDGKKLTSIPKKKHLQSASKKLEMSDCKRSVSPRLDKSCTERNNEELSEEEASKFRSSVLPLLYLSSERTDIQSTVRLLCTKLKSPTALEMRQLKRLLRCVKAQRTCQQCLRCVTTMTEEDNGSNDWKSTQNLTGRAIKRHGKARVAQ